MTEKYHEDHRSRVPLCVDVNSEWVPGIDGGSVTQSFLYFAEVICRGLTCLPYMSGGEMTCVVCTK